MNKKNTMAVHATLLVAPACPYCPQIKKTLNELLASKHLASLDIVDISVDFEKAEKIGVRSVPWLAMNSLELQGAHTEAEIKYWLDQASRKDGRQQLFDNLLEVGQISQVESMLRRNPDGLSDLLTLFADQERQINVRIGASAVLESLQGSGLLEQAVDEIANYTLADDASTRIDACHVLSFIQHPVAISMLKVALNDVDEEVREVALDSLETLSGSISDQQLH